MKISDIPFHQFMGYAYPETEGQGLLALPGSPDYHNHLGTVHAGAQFSLAESCSGAYLLARFPDLAREYVGMVRKAEIKYSNPGRGTLYARAEMEPEAEAGLVKTLEQRGRAFATIRVVLVDEAEQITARADLEWFFQRLPE
jgi:acyl-coenzyme A thioesterase PaaI-like protein